MKKLKTIKDFNAGFTLIELIVVMFILVTLTSITLINYRSGGASHSLSNTSQKLISDLRKVQNLAISGVNIKDAYCGYGILVDTSSDPYSYIIYADETAVCSASNNKYDAGTDVVLETITLIDNIKIDSASPDPVDVFFKPPSPTTYINGIASLSSVATIDLIAEGFSGISTKIITVNGSGLIQSE